MKNRKEAEGNSTSMGRVSQGPRAPTGPEHERIEGSCRECGAALLAAPWFIECEPCQNERTTRGRVYPKEPKKYVTSS